MERARDQSVLSSTIVQEAEAVVSDFIHSRNVAIGRLYRIFDPSGSYPKEHQQQRRSAFDGFCAQIGWESMLQNSATATGNHVTGGGGKRSDTSGFTEQQERTIEARFADLERSAAKDRAAKHRLAEELEAERESKRPRLDLSQLPWVQRERDSPDTTHPDCAKTRKLLRLFSSDPEFVVTEIRLATNTPLGFPESEWSNIVQGLPVDLNVVFDHLNCVYRDDGQPARRIVTAFDWYSAWQATAEAYTFVFNHRERELQEYGYKILRMFNARVPESAPRVILYDSSIRHHVAGGQQMLLNDPKDVQHIYDAILCPDGIAYNISQPGQSSPQVKGERATRYCNKFNRISGCEQSASACRYSHICRKCNRRGHGMATCQI